LKNINKNSKKRNLINRKKIMNKIEERGDKHD